MEAEHPECPEWVTLAEAVRRLGKSEKTLRKHLAGGTVRGRRVRVRGIDEWRVWLGPELPEVAPERLEVPECPARQAVPEPPESPALPELFRELMAKYEAACVQVGYYKSEMEHVHRQMPTLTEHAESAQARAASARARVRAWTVAACLLALVSAVMGGMLLTGTGRGTYTPWVEAREVQQHPRSLQGTADAPAPRRPSPRTTDNAASRSAAPKARADRKGTAKAPSVR